MKKRILSLVVVLSMLIGCVPLIAHAATSGTCGDNVYWTLDDEGTLTISGTGDMNYYDPNVSAPYGKNIKSVVIKNGVKSIDSEAFEGCSSLKDVYYSGSEEQWKKINIRYSNEELTSATIHYNSGGTVTPQPTVTFTPSTPSPPYRPSLRPTLR